MTPADFRAWRDRLWLSQSEAAAELGYTVRQVKRWEKDPELPDEPPPYPIPRVVELACMALETGPLSIVRRRAQAADRR